MVRTVSGGRARGGELAERINAAVELVEAGTSAAEAARLLAARYGCSPRQGHRYVERALESGRIEVPGPVAVFTVKVPVQLVVRVRAHAAASGRTISSVVTQALEEFLSRRHREHERR